MVKEVVKGYINNVKEFVQEDAGTIMETLHDLKELCYRVRDSSIKKWQKVLCYILLAINILFISVLTFVCIGSVIIIKAVMALVLTIGIIPHHALTMLLDKENKR